MLGLTLGERCRAAAAAYEIAARALNIGQQRASGATLFEIKEEYDARVDLRNARADYITDAKRFIAISRAELRASQHEIDS